MNGTAAVVVRLFVIAIPLLAWAVEAGVALTASHLLAFALIGLAATVSIRRRQWPPLDLANGAMVAFAAVAAITTVLVLTTPDQIVGGLSTHARSVKQLAGLAFTTALFISLRHVMQRFGLADMAIRTHVWTATAVAVLVLAQFAVALQNPESSLAVLPVHNSTLGQARALGYGTTVYGFPRVALTLIEPSMLATYLLTGWGFSLYALQWKRKPRPGLWDMLAVVVLGTAIVMTGSRLAYVVFAATAAGALVLRPSRLIRTALVAASLAGAALILGPPQVMRVVGTLAPPRQPAPILTSTPAAVPPPAPTPAPEVAPPAATTPDVPPPGGGDVTGDRPPTPASPVAETVPAQAIAQTPPAEADPSVLDRVVGRLIARGDVIEESTRQRAASVIVAIEVWRQYPWLGAGYGLADFAMHTWWPADLTPVERPFGVPPTMMSSYAMVVTETGTLGALCVALLGLAVVASLWRERRRGPAGAARAAGLAGALGTYALTAVASTLIVYQFLLVWLLLAAATSLGDAEASDAAPPP